MATNYNSKIVTDGLVALYDSSNPKSWGLDGSKWKDASKNSNDGSITGAIHSQGPFPGAGYVTFDGNDDYLTGPNSTDFNLSGNFTAECWFYVSALPNQNNSSGRSSGLITYTQGTSNSGWEMYVDHTNNLLVLKKYGYNSRIICNFTCALNTWYHVAVVKDTSTRYIFINGVSQTLTTDDFAWTTPTGSPILYIGSGWSSQSSGYKHQLNGYLSNVRIVNGTALYTSNFTPSLIPLTAVPNTKLLTCQGGSIVDASLKAIPHSISVTGNAAAVYNDISYFDFDGTDDYVILDASFQVSTSKVYSFEAWIYKTAGNASNSGMLISGGYGGDRDGIIINTEDYTSSNDIRIQSENGNVAAIYYNGVSQTLDQTVSNQPKTSSNFNLNEWVHIVVTGIQVLSTDGAAHHIGQNNNNTNRFSGKIANLKIYDKALTSTEVTKNFNALRGRFV